MLLRERDEFQERGEGRAGSASNFSCGASTWIFRSRSSGPSGGRGSKRSEPVPGLTHQNTLYSHTAVCPVRKARFARWAALADDTPAAMGATGSFRERTQSIQFWRWSSSPSGLS